LVLSLPEDGQEMPLYAPMPDLPAFLQRSTRSDHGVEDLRQGFTVEVWLKSESLDADRAAGQTVLLDNRTASGQGFCLQTTDRATIEIVLNDGRTENRWETGPGLLPANTAHHVVAIVDAGPKIISFVVDGVLHDGGTARQFGWGRFSPHLRGASGAPVLRIAACVLRARLYNRYLRTSEAIGNYRAGLQRKA
jgi:hypothetical protein